MVLAVLPMRRAPDSTLSERAGGARRDERQNLDCPGRTVPKRLQWRSRPEPRISLNNRGTILRPAPLAVSVAMLMPGSPSRHLLLAAATQPPREPGPAVY